MKVIKMDKCAIHLYCDKEFLIRMSKIDVESISNESFSDKKTNDFLVNMYLLPKNIDNDKVTSSNQKLHFYFSKDTFSIICLIAKKLEEDDELVFSELGELESKHKNINLYIYLLDT